MSEWRPIDTAPKDGTYIILAHFGEDGVEVVGGDWNLYPKEGQEGLHGFRAWIDDPTHWMPIVPPLPNPSM